MKNAWIAMALLTALAIASAADARRPPGRQITARAYLACIDAYHAYVHPVTGRFVRCRFRPTCSNYSTLAVRRFGIVRGLQLTSSRLWSCRQSIPPGTIDAVPNR